MTLKLRSLGASCPKNKWAAVMDDQEELLFAIAKDIENLKTKQNEGRSS